MKRNIFTKTAASILFGAFIASGLTGCADPIFHNIREEVRLEKMTIHGEIYTFARLKDGPSAELLFANGKIYHKNAAKTGHGGWEQFSKPDGQVLTIATDANDNIYALSIFYEKEDADGEMQVTGKKIYWYDNSTGSWALVPGLPAMNKDTKCRLMGTNSVIKANRHAYAVIGGKGYELKNGTSSVCSAADNKKSCASLNGTTRFHDGEAACSNADDTIVYYASGINVVAEGAVTGTIANGIRSNVYGLAACGDAVLVSTSSGSALVHNTTGHENQEIQFENLTSTLSTLYECRGCIVADPSKNYRDAIFYAGITVYGSGSNSALFTHEGLWSYYPERGKWNVE